MNGLSQVKTCLSLRNEEKSVDYQIEIYKKAAEES